MTQPISCSSSHLELHHWFSSPHFLTEFFLALARILPFQPKNPTAFPIRVHSVEPNREKTAIVTRLREVREIQPPIPQIPMAHRQSLQRCPLGLVSPIQTPMRPRR